MITSKVFVLYFVILLAYSVSGSGDDEVKPKFSRPRPRYRYNHPPAADDYASIPVAVVYDKVIDRSSRQQKSIETTITDNKNSKSDKERSEIKVQEPTKVEIPTVSEKTDDVTVKSNRDDVIVKPSVTTTVPISKQIKLESKIPVAVVYDEDPKVIQRVKAVRTRVRKQNRKPLNIVSESAKELEVSVKTKALEAKPVLTPATTERQMTNQKETTTVKTETAPKQIVGKKDSTNTRTQNVSTKKETVTELPKDTATNIKKRTREPDPVVPILESENRVFSHTGEFLYSYEGGDGTKAYSKGALKTFDEDKTGEAVEGGFSYKDKEGNDFSLSYTADENGYRPTGAHLPTPPPIPPAIARALKYLATKTTPAPVTESLDAE